MNKIDLLFMLPQRHQLKTMIELAVEVATVAHDGQFRKGTDIPYITHPMAVGLLLSGAGCSAELVAAGILHDTVEDTPVEIDYIQNHFGKHVADIVKGCSEPDKQASWRKRKTHTIDYLKTAPLEVRIVSCADKLNNVQAIACDYKQIGDEVWKRFNKGKKDQKWYYQGLVESICRDTEETLFIFKQFRQEVATLFCEK